MPLWAWILLGLSALGFVLWLVEYKTGIDVTERFGRALAILLILAVLAILIVSFANVGWE